MTAREIKEVLKKEYTTYDKQRVIPQTWVFWEELKNGVGFDKYVMGYIDFFVMNVFPSKQFEKIAYEIKVSRSDFFNEIKNPNKRRFAMAMSNKFYFITPKGLLKPNEIPKECGLEEVCNNGKYLYTQTIVPAIWRETLPPNWAFVSSLCRKLFLKIIEEKKQ